LISHTLLPVNIPSPHLHHQATAASASCNAKGGCLAGKLLTPTETLGDVELELFVWRQVIAGLMIRAYEKPSGFP